MAYIPRTSTTSPSQMVGNNFYYAWNVFQPQWAPPVQIGNCTWYSWGRFWEISGATSQSEKRPTLCTYDANDWWSYNDGYQRSQTPQLGSVLCLYGGNYSGLGHVAIVEEILPNGNIYTSESALNGYYFQYKLRRPPNYEYDPDDGYIFRGFIINPYAEGGGGGGNLKPWLAGNILKRRKENDNAKSRFTLAVWDRKLIQL